MRLLGIDYGTKKVGLAITDEAGTMAFPHTVLLNDSFLLKTIEELIQEKGVTQVVVGHSLNHDGTPNAVQREIEEFIADLTLRMPIPIMLEPEQFTSVAAARTTGKNDMIDAAAAALILESFLAKQSINGASQRQTTTSETDAVAEIDFAHFAALEIKIGTITAVEIVEDADKLLKLTVDVGEASQRQIVSGIREFFTDEQILVGRQCPFVTNLQARKIRGLISQGMIMAAGSDDDFSLLHPSRELPPGTTVG